MTEQSENSNEATGGASAVDRGVSVLDPSAGLTLKKGNREATVQDVIDGVVFYAVYLDGDDWPIEMYQATEDVWRDLANKAIENGAEVFTNLRANV